MIDAAAGDRRPAAHADRTEETGALEQPPLGPIVCGPDALAALLREPLVACVDDSVPASVIERLSVLRTPVIRVAVAPDHGLQLLGAADAVEDVAIAVRLRPSAVIVAPAHPSPMEGALRAQLAVGVWGEGATPPDVRICPLDGFTDAVAEAMRDLLDHRARLTGMLAQEINALRLEYEHVNQCLLGLQRSAQSERRPVGGVSTIVSRPAAHDMAALGPSGGDDGYMLAQPINRSAGGLAGLDLYVDVTDGRAKGDLVFDLISHDRRKALASWSMPYPDRTGWIFLPLEEVLSAHDVFLSLTAQWRHIAGAPPRLVARRHQAFFDGHVTENGQVLADTHLTHRVWTGAAGSKTQFSPDPTAPIPFAQHSFLTCARRAAAMAKMISYRRAFDAVKLEPDDDGVRVTGKLQELFGVCLPSAVAAGSTAFASSVGVTLVVHAAPSAPFRFRIRVSEGLPQWSRGGPDRIRIENELAASDWMVVRAAGDYAASVELASDASQADSGDADWACTIDVLALDGDEDEWIDVDFSILSPRAAWNAPAARIEWAHVNRLPTPADPHEDAAKTLFSRRERHRAMIEQGVLRRPLASLLCPIHRVEDVPRLMATVNQQLYDALEAVIIMNSDALDEEMFERLASPGRRYAIVRAPQDELLGAALNRGAAQARGEVLLKIDADDLYFPNYVGDMCAQLALSGADIAGKRAGFVYIEETDEIFLRLARYENRFSDQTFGGTMTFHRSVWEETKFRETTQHGTDLAFFQDCLTQGRSVYAADRFNYVYIRYQKPGHHTWAAERDAVLGPDPLFAGRWPDRGVAVR